MLPIRFVQVLDLIPLGILPQDVAFSTCTMESDKYICVISTDPETKQKSFVKIDLHKPVDENLSNVYKRPLQAAENAIMHPTRDVISLRAGSAGEQYLQVYDLGKKTKITSLLISNGTTGFNMVTYWTWISDTTMALIGDDKYVYHWSVTPDFTTFSKVPQKMWKLDEALDNAQIIKVRADTVTGTIIVIGVTLENNFIKGKMQIYSYRNNTSEFIDGISSGSFGLIDNVTHLFYSDKSRFYVRNLLTNEITFSVLPSMEAADFPVAMEISNLWKVAYILTKFGYIYICSFHTEPKLIFTNRICIEAPFASSYYDSHYGGIITINRKGLVLSVTIDTDNIVPYISSYLKDDSLSYHFHMIIESIHSKSSSSLPLATSTTSSTSSSTIEASLSSLTLDSYEEYNHNSIIKISDNDFNNLNEYESGSISPASHINRSLSGSPIPRSSSKDDFTKIEKEIEDVKQQFTVYLRISKYDDATKLVLSRPDVLRNSESLKLIETCSNPSEALRVYFRLIGEHTKYTKEESILLINKLIQKNDKLSNIEMIRNWLSNEKLECSEILGDIVLSNLDFSTALAIYMRAECHHKVYPILFQQKMYDKLFPYIKKYHVLPDINSLPGNVDIEHALLLTKNGIFSVEQIIENYMKNNEGKLMVGYMMEYLKGDREEDSEIQTRFLETLLTNGLEAMAGKIISGKIITRYDKNNIAKLLDKIGMYQLAIDNYDSWSNQSDINRILINHFGDIDKNYLIEKIGTLQPEVSFEIIESMLRNDPDDPTVLSITKLYYHVMYPDIIPIFEKHHAIKSIYYLLDSQDDLNEYGVEKYIESAMKLRTSNVIRTDHLFNKLSPLLPKLKNQRVISEILDLGLKEKQFKQLESICSTLQSYDFNEFKSLVKITNDKPEFITNILRIICEKSGSITEYIEFLYFKKLRNLIVDYCKSIQLSQLSQIIDYLFDVEAEEKLIEQVLHTSPLVSESMIDQNEDSDSDSEDEIVLERKSSTKSIQSQSQSQPQQINKSIEEIKIKEIIKKLKKYKERVDGLNKAGNDEEYIRICIRNKLLMRIVRYLHDANIPDLWRYVIRKFHISLSTSTSNVILNLRDSNKEDKEDTSRDPTLMEPFIESIIKSQLLLTDKDMSDLLRSFMMEELADNIIKVLGNLLIRNDYKYKNNKNLQNLLILTIMGPLINDPELSIKYVKLLDSYDYNDIASIALSKNYYDVAIESYKKGKCHDKSLDIIINILHDLNRAFDYAYEFDDPIIWRIVGLAQWKVYNQSKNQ